MRNKNTKSTPIFARLFSSHWLRTLSQKTEKQNYDAERNFLRFFCWFSPSTILLPSPLSASANTFSRVLNGLKLYSQHLKYFLSLVRYLRGSFLPLFLYECITLTLDFADTSFILLLYCVCAVHRDYGHFSSHFDVFFLCSLYGTTY